MKKFNLLKASSLILSSYFIIGLSSCSSNKENKRYVEVSINDILLEKLNIDEYLESSKELKAIFDKFSSDYQEEKIYIFNIPRTYKEYQLYKFDGKDYINIGYITKNFNEISFEYYINENNYQKNLKYFLDYNYNKELKTYSYEITYNDLESNLAYKVYNDIDKSIIYNENKSILEIILFKDENKIKFRYDLVNNIEIEITKEEYEVLEDSLIKSYQDNNLGLFFEDNSNFLLEILSHNENDILRYEYNLIVESINNFINKSKIRVK